MELSENHGIVAFVGGHEGHGGSGDSCESVDCVDTPLALDLGPSGCEVALEIPESLEAIPTLRWGPAGRSIVRSRWGRLIS